MVSFHEVHKDAAALTAHVAGSFSAFKATRKDLFLTMRVFLPNGTCVDDLCTSGNSVKRLAGFVRPGAAE